MKWIDLLLSEGGYDCADSRIVICSLQSPEGGCDFGLDFCMPDISFSLIIGERDNLMERKSEQRLLMIDESIEEVSALGVFRFTPSSWDRLRFFQIRAIADSIKSFLNLLAGFDRFRSLLGFFVQINQEALHVFSPKAFPIDQSLKLSENMGSTKGMFDLSERKIRSPTIMNEPVS